ncbi:MAG: glycosyltransferase [Lachnospiraceae bacterium]|nr:glycosyltransferase [Lachnospiraceae bacterium]
MEHFSICIIAKNEEKNIEKCLQALLPLEEEIIVIDTGSTDRTKEIAAKYTDNLYDFTWISDFSAARNFSLEKAKNDWVLVLDCDEYVTSFNKDEIQNFIYNHPEKVGKIEHHNLVGSKETEESIYIDYLARFFDKRLFQFEGAIHEQICAKNHKPYNTEPIAIQVFHDGYFGTPEERMPKLQRNLDMLLDALKQQPDNIYILFQLGQTYKSLHQYEEALSYYNAALSHHVNYNSEAALDLVCGWINCLNELHRSVEALSILEHYDELSKYADFVLLMGHVYTNTGQYIQAIGEYLKATTIPTCKKEGANTFLPFYHIGNIQAAIGDINMAKLMYEKCGNYPPAKEALDNLFS